MSAAVEQVSAPTPSQQDPRVLLVDDSGLVRRLACELLAEAGFPVREAPDAAEALELAQRAPIEILVTDLRLQGASGLDLARQMRASQPRLKVLFLSADPSNEVLAASVPGARFLDKSEMVDRLAKVVAELLRTGNGSGNHSGK